MKNYLKRFVEDCLKNNDGPPPPGFPRWADEIANRYIPEPVYVTPAVPYNVPFDIPDLPPLEEIEIGSRPTAVEKVNVNVGNAIAIGAGAAGACYVTYRIVRLLPSLAPPLWPTLPVNLAVP